MKDFSRAERVGDQIHAELSRALLVEVSDPRLNTVSLTAIKLSDCLRHARVYWLPLSTDALDEREQRRVQRALERAEPFLRGHLSRQLNLRYTPELKFLFDEAVMHGRRVDSLLSELEPVERQETKPAPTSDQDDE